MSISISTLADGRRFADAGPRPFLPVNVLVAVVAILLALVTPCVTQAQGAEEEIKATLVDMWDALEHGDLERYASHVHDNFTSFGENDRYLKEGKDYELRGNRNWLSQTKGVHTDMPPTPGHRSGRHGVDHLLLDGLWRPGGWGSLQQRGKVDPHLRA